MNVSDHLENDLETAKQRQNTERDRDEGKKRAQNRFVIERLRISICDLLMGNWLV